MIPVAKNKYCTVTVNHCPSGQAFACDSWIYSVYDSLVRFLLTSPEETLRCQNGQYVLTCMHSFAKNPEQWFVGEIAFLVLESPFMRAYSVSRVRS